MRDTVNLGKSVATMRNRVAAGCWDDEGAEKARAVCCCPKPLGERGATKPVTPCTAVNAQHSAPIPLMMVRYVSVAARLLCAAEPSSCDKKGSTNAEPQGLKIVKNSGIGTPTTMLYSGAS